MVNERRSGLGASISTAFHGGVQCDSIHTLSLHHHWWIRHEPTVFSLRDDEVMILLRQINSMPMKQRLNVKAFFEEEQG